MRDSEVLQPIKEALHDFEEAVKTHEHRSMAESEMVRRQAVDRAREDVLKAVLKLLDEARASG